MRETPGLATLAAAGLCLAGVTVMVGGSAGSPDLIGDLLALGMTALMALMMVIMRCHPDRPMTLVGPVSCLQLVAIGWVMSAQLDVSARELVLLAGFGVVHAAATVLLAEGVLRIRAAEAALLGALEVPLAPLWGWLILSEIPRMPIVAGGAVVLVTLAWYLGRETRVRCLRARPSGPGFCNGGKSCHSHLLATKMCVETMQQPGNGATDHGELALVASEDLTDLDQHRFDGDRGSLDLPRSARRRAGRELHPPARVSSIFTSSEGFSMC